MAKPKSGIKWKTLTVDEKLVEVIEKLKIEIGRQSGKVPPTNSVLNLALLELAKNIGIYKIEKLKEQIMQK